MPNGCARGSSAGDGIADLVYVVYERLRLSAQTRVVLNAGRADAVQIFRTNGDTSDEVGESRTVLFNGALARKGSDSFNAAKGDGCQYSQGNHFVVEVSLTS